MSAAKVLPIHEEAEYLIANLKRAIRRRSQKAFISCTGRKDVEIAEVEIPDDFMYGQYLAHILIYSPTVQVTFKAHFSLRASRELSATLFGKKAEEVETLQAWDFMKEYCNQAAGSIDTNLRACGFGCGLSLPIVTSGFDEIFFSEKRDPEVKRDWWVLRWDTGKVTCSSETLARDWTPFSELAGDEHENGEDKNEIEDMFI